MNRSAPIGEPEVKVTAPLLSGAGMDRPRRRSPARRWRVAAAVAGALLVIVAIFAVSRDGATVASADTTIGSVRLAPLQDYVPVRAEMLPAETNFVVATSGGQVERILVDDGAIVQAGAVIAQLRNPSLRMEVTSREAEIAGRLADLSEQQLQIEAASQTRGRELADSEHELLLARRELAIRRQLYDRGFESNMALQTATAEAEHYERRIALLRRSAVSQQRISSQLGAQNQTIRTNLSRNLNEVRDSLYALILRSPVGGRVTDLQLHPGQSLNAGDRIAQVDSMDAYKALAQVDEIYLSRVRAGQSAVGTLDGRDVRLKVTRVLPNVSDGRFRAELDFAGAAPVGVRRGQTLDVRINLGASPSANLVPTGAWLEESGGRYAFVVTADERRAARRPIRIGRRTPEAVEVLSGLQPGEKIITTSYESFGEAKTVRIK